MRTTPYLIVLLSLFFLMTVSAQDVVIDDSTLLVVWTADGDLNAWDSTTGDQRTLATGDVLPITPTISPTGDQIAFVRADGDRESLWIVDALGGEPQMIASGDVYGWRGWSADGTLYFSILDVDGLGARPSGQVFAVADRTITSVTYPGEPESVFPSVSPAGTRLLAIDPGIYNEREANIYLGESTLLSYPAVASGSHVGHLPALRWIDDTTVQIIIDDANALYNTLSDDRTPAIVWQLDLDEGSAERVGALDVAFGVGGVRWSGSGDAIVYPLAGDVPRSEQGWPVIPMAVTNLTTGAIVELGEVVVPPVWLPGDMLLVSRIEGEMLTVYQERPFDGQSTRWASFAAADGPSWLAVGPGLLVVDADGLHYTPVEEYAPQQITPFDRLSERFAAIVIPQ